MEILSSSQRLVLLEYLSVLRFQRADWLIVEAKLIDGAAGNLTADGVAAILQRLYPKYEGRILVCNKSEALMVIKWGQANSPNKLVKEIRTEFPGNTCEVAAAPATFEGLKKIEMMIAPPTPEKGPFFKMRVERQENIFLIADDDMYMRTLARKGLESLGSVIEVSEGSKVVETYKEHNPDIVLLDIHMPGLEGPEVLTQLKSVDPSAYVIMLSADSSRENVQWTHQHGAKGFLAKPFNKAKLIEWVDACPTIK